MKSQTLPKTQHIQQHQLVDIIKAQVMALEQKLIEAKGVDC